MMFMSLYLVQSINLTPNHNQYYQCNNIEYHIDDDTLHKIDTQKSSIDDKSVSNCVLTNGGDTSECIPTKVALQILNLNKPHSSYFPVDNLNANELELAGRASALSQYAYYHGMKLGDRFYDGTVIQIINFDFQMTGTGIPDHEMIDAGELSAFRWKSDDDKITAIVFRGTDYIKNWSIDFYAKSKKINTTNGCKGKMQSGIYYAMHDNLESEWIKLLNTDDFKQGHTVLLTGHSLGSGLAHAMYFELQCNPKMNEYAKIKKGTLKVYGFGSPAIFNQDLVNTLDTDVGSRDILTFCKTNDPITFTAEHAQTFLDGVLDATTKNSSIFKQAWKHIQDHLSVSTQYIRHKMNAKPYNKLLLKAGLKDVKYYVHLGKVIETTNPSAGYLEEAIDLLEHAEYLNVYHDDLKKNGNKGWYCKKPKKITAAAPAAVSHAAFYSIAFSIFLSFIVSLFFYNK